MLSFILFTLFTALAVRGLVSAEWLPAATVLLPFVGFVLFAVLTLWPQAIMAMHRYTLTVENAVKYNLLVRWVVLPLVTMLGLLGLYLGARFEDFRITMVTFYLLDVGYFCIYPLLRWLAPKVRGYLQIKKACETHGFRMEGSFLGFLFPRESTPALTIETPAERFSVRVLGGSSETQKYSFGRGQTYRVQKIQHYVANYIDELEHEGDCTALRWIKALYFGKEKEKVLAAPVEGATNILLFAPDFAYCTVEGRNAPIEVGNAMKDYVVYNVRSFVRGRLAGAAHAAESPAEPALRGMPKTA